RAAVVDADGAHRGRVRHHPRAGSRHADAGVSDSLCGRHRRGARGVFPVAGEAMTPLFRHGSSYAEQATSAAKRTGPDTARTGRGRGATTTLLKKWSSAVCPRFVGAVSGPVRVQAIDTCTSRSLAWRTSSRSLVAALLGMTGRVAALLGMTIAFGAQAHVSPNKRYYALHTKRFYIHFTAATEPTARRVASDAERAYAQLASELHPPRGPIDVVISDDADYSNGSATPFPTNRIVVYANPPIQSSSLRFTDDWGAMVITHELTHIFHLDRTRGIWRLAQFVFGRSPYFFPNEYDPSWLTEGLAVYYESRFTGAGR